jgi:hypothetical protein
MSFLSLPAEQDVRRVVFPCKSNRIDHIRLAKRLGREDQMSDTQRIHLCDLFGKEVVDASADQDIVLDAERARLAAELGSGDPIIDPAQRYSLRAEECRTLADSCRNVETKITYESLARTYDRMADTARRNASS